MDTRTQAPGLKWMKRAGGRTVPYWVADAAAKDAGFRPKTVNLSKWADNPAVLVQRCIRLDQEQRAFLSPLTATDHYDGTFASLLRLYETHEASAFHAVKPHTRDLYSTYLPTLRAHIGAVPVAGMNGLRLKSWFAEWRKGEAGADHLARARVVLAVFRAAIAFGVQSGFDDCLKMAGIMSEMEFPRPRPRKQFLTAAQVVAARQAAHAMGRPSMAFGIALQFETGARQWDITGQWVPLDDHAPSAVIFGQDKWLGPTWAQIDRHMVFGFTPSKTDGTTGAVVRVDLSLCPMVMEEMARIAPEARKGPLIVNERTGLPYFGEAYGAQWRRIRKAAGIPSDVWNRDLRASAITEGDMAGARRDDLSKQAGHSGTAITSRVYGREALEAQRRAATKRKQFREG